MKQEWPRCEWPHHFGEWPHHFSDTLANGHTYETHATRMPHACHTHVTRMPRAAHVCHTHATRMTYACLSPVSTKVYDTLVRHTLLITRMAILITRMPLLLTRMTYRKVCDFGMSHVLEDAAAASARANAGGSVGCQQH